MDAIRFNLIAVRTLLTPSEAWGQNTYARTATGAYVDPCDPLAVCFCLRGALARVCLGLNTEAYVNACRHLKRFVPEGMTIISINDGEDELPDLTPHQAILSILDKAIEGL